MTVPSKLADQLVERVFGPVKRPAAPAQEAPGPPRSVIAQLKEGRRRGLESRRVLRELKRF